MKPKLCPSCAYQSTVDSSKYFCKMCLVTEKMDNYEPELDEEEKKPSHNIVCVASVSFDKTKKQFDYSKFDPSVMGE